MKNVLLTGMTAQHTSERLGKRTQSFSSLMRTALTEHGWNVEQLAPSLEWTEKDFEKYESVVVGIAPLTSTSAHRAYGALGALDVLQNDPRLTLLVDAPEPYKIWTSLKTVERSTESLVKPFYKNRYEYAKATEPAHHERLVKTVRNLLNNPWPKTVYAALPWSEDGHLVSQVPALCSSSLFSVCLDAFILRDTVKPATARSSTSWWCATTLNTDWIDEVSKQLHHMIVPVKKHPKSSDSEVLATVAGAIGLLVSTYRNGIPWWTNKLAQSLAINTPVLTDWRNSAGLGSDWVTLPSAVESMDRLERYEMAIRQRVTYAEAVPSTQAAASRLAICLQDQLVGVV